MSRNERSSDAQNTKLAKQVLPDTDLAASSSSLSSKIKRSILHDWTYPLPVNFILGIQDSVIDYTKGASQEKIATEVFDDAVSYSSSIRDIVSGLFSYEKIEDALIEQITLAIFGSNFIERAGLPLDQTIQLCRTVFYDDVPFSIFSKFSEYQARLENLVQSPEESLRSTEVRDRREVVNHAGAFIYMIDRIINNDELFSEELICETHRILVHGIDAIHQNAPATPYQRYGGIYRQVHVSAGSSNFVNPRFIGRAMERFVQELNQKMVTAESSRELDPFFIAADACGEFVNIHPFLDGNGRTCRLILNTILLKYAGIVAPIGEQSGEREEYLEIARRRSEDESGNGELALYTLHKGRQSLKVLQEKLV
ncbi:hypothetical protein AA313_de0200695 [Arthrobotrys entomopaga]|nr:hypothetical protein AA313_de0200695 [Arthrobotrys entomopaga]